MSTTGSVLEPGAVRQQWRLHLSRTRARSYLLSPPRPPPPPPGGPRTRHTLRLPTLASHNPSRMLDAPSVSLSLSEPSLFISAPKVTQGANRFPRRRRPPPRKHTPQLPLCRLCDPGGRSQTCCKPTYTHLSCPIRPAVKLSPAPSRNRLASATQLGTRRQAFASPLPAATHQGPLAVRGTPCLPSQPSQPAPLAPPTQGRAQLHVFLPVEAAAAEELDSESVDEGFMDELDSKVTSLKIQQHGASKAPLQ